MFNRFFYLSLFLLFKIILSLKSTDFCHVAENECKGHYQSNIYQIKCELKKCVGKYSYQCGPGLCSTRNASCVKHQSITQMFNSMFKSIKYKHEKENFITFNQNINKCPIDPYLWNLNDICLNEKQCLQNNEFVMRSGVVRFQKLINCPCKEKFNYHCGKNYCALNKQACDAFDLKYLKNSKSLIKEIKSCGNHHRNQIKI